MGEGKRESCAMIAGIERSDRATTIFYIPWQVF